MSFAEEVSQTLGLWVGLCITLTVLNLKNAHRQITSDCTAGLYLFSFSYSSSIVAQHTIRANESYHLLVESKGGDGVHNIEVPSMSRCTAFFGRRHCPPPAPEIKHYTATYRKISKDFDH